MIWFSKYKNVVDQLNFFWTSFILLVFVLVIGFLRYFYLLSLITCWTPSQFTTSYNLYAHQTCWEKHVVYKQPLENELVPFEKKDTQTSVLHGWIPILAVYLIIGFKIPEAIKALLDVYTGAKPHSLVTVTDSWKERSDSLAASGRDFVNRSSIVKTLSFFSVNILILVNLVAQFIYVQIYFRDNVNNNATVDNTTVNVLPKVILCDFEILQFDNVRNFRVQCQMPVNHFYQVFFRIYSYWILGVGLFTGAMFLFQLGTLMVPQLVGIRFRGIIPEKELKMRGFSVDDSLVFLGEVRDEYGMAMARSVASKIWESKKITYVQANVPAPVGGDGSNQASGNEYSSGGASVYPLLERPTTHNSDIA